MLVESFFGGAFSTSAFRCFATGFLLSHFFVTIGSRQVVKETDWFMRRKGHGFEIVSPTCTHSFYLHLHPFTYSFTYSLLIHLRITHSSAVINAIKNFLIFSNLCNGIVSAILAYPCFWLQYNLALGILMQCMQCKNCLSSSLSSFRGFIGSFSIEYLLDSYFVQSIVYETSIIFSCFIAVRHEYPVPVNFSSSILSSFVFLVFSIKFFSLFRHLRY